MFNRVKRNAQRARDEGMIEEGFEQKKTFEALDSLALKTKSSRACGSYHCHCS